MKIARISAFALGMIYPFCSYSQGSPKVVGQVLEVSIYKPPPSWYSQIPIYIIDAAAAYFGIPTSAISIATPIILKNPNNIQNNAYYAGALKAPVGYEICRFDLRDIGAFGGTTVQLQILRGQPPDLQTHGVGWDVQLGAPGGFFPGGAYGGASGIAYFVRADGPFQELTNQGKCMPLGFFKQCKDTICRP